jgi:membrane-bound lytic murein transglycosylase
MGNRGTVGQKGSIVPKTVDGIEPPANMDGQALAFFTRNQHTVLGVEDYDSFCILCGLYQDVMNAANAKDKEAATRQYIMLAKQYGLTPESRKRLQVSSQDRHASKPEFDF